MLSYTKKETKKVKRSNLIFFFLMKFFEHFVYSKFEIETLIHVFPYFFVIVYCLCDYVYIYVCVCLLRNFRQNA